MWAQMKNIKEKSAAIYHIASIFDAEIFYLRQVLWQDLIGGAIYLLIHKYYRLGNNIGNFYKNLTKDNKADA